MRFVEVEEAEVARGLRLVVAGRFPSPWSQAAMGLFDMKGIDYLAVRSHIGADKIKAWTGSRNVPVVLFDDEPARTGWAEILALAERLGGTLSLVPAQSETRVRLLGLAHELMGEDGLCWNARLLLIHASFSTEGRAGWPVPVAAYLAPRYGYAPERVEQARARTLQLLGLFGEVLEQAAACGHQYLLGPVATALDIYAATSVGAFAPLPHDVCPMISPVRHAFETMDPAVAAAVPPSLLRHRDLMYQRHLVLPVRF